MSVRYPCSHILPFTHQSQAATISPLSLTHQRLIPLEILVEAIGYIARAVSSTQSPNWSTGPYIIQSLLLLLAPPLFAASIYMVLSRLIKLTHGEQYSIISARWLTAVFVSGDVVSFLAQSTGMTSRSVFEHEF